MRLNFRLFQWTIPFKNIIEFDIVSKTFVPEIRDETEEFKSAINQTQQFMNNHPVQLMETCELIQAKSLIKSSITISKLNDNDSSKVKLKKKN